MTVLALIDRSRFAESVCDHAAWVARRLGTGVEVLHAIERPPQLMPTDLSGRLGFDTAESLLRDIAALDEERNRLAQESARHLLDAATVRLRDAGVDQIRQRLIHGDLADYLHGHAGDAQMVVMGRSGESGEGATSHLGRNLERVVRGAQRPVLVTAPTFRPIEQFLFAFGGGPGTGTATRFLVETPLLAGAEGHLLHVGEPTERATEHMADAARRLRASGLQLTEQVHPGDPATVIGEVIAEREADLLVMGAFGHSRFHMIVLGSTTVALLQSIPVSMLLFHA